MSDERHAGVRPQGAVATCTAEVEMPSTPEEGSHSQRFALVIYCGKATAVVRLERNLRLVVGRDFPSHVLVDDPAVSRQHARFWLEGATVHVEDLGSRNGTRVNGARIKHAGFSLGDQVELGSARIALAMTLPSPQGASADEADAIVVRNASVVSLYALARRVALTDMPVLVLGETGTGKEHLARTIHSESPRAKGPWRALNCGAIAPSLAESSLFGHERGAFTGADKRSRGLFEDAEGGSVFLDEVAELPLTAQAALLRVLETKTFQRVGSTQELKADVRLVAATHCDLNAAVAEGTFRKDLLYRINPVTLELPPLRERKDEIEPLIERFLARCRAEWGLKVDDIEPEAFQRLQAYAWPGNIRQLRNAIELASLVAPSRCLRIDDLPAYLRGGTDATPSRTATSTALPAPATKREAGTLGSVALDNGLKSALREHEARMIEEALQRTGGNRNAAAKLLRIPTRTFYRRMQGLGLIAGDSAPIDLELDSKSESD